MIWQTKKISEVFIIRPPKSEVKQSISNNDMVSFIPMEDLGVFARSVNPSQQRKLVEVNGSYTYFGENDVLLAKITPCFENGKLGIARNLTNEVGFGSSEYIVFRSTGEVISEFLFYVLSSDDFRDEGKKRMTGSSGHRRLSKEYIENYKVSYPESITEQKRIVKTLDEAFVAIAKAKENIEENLQNSHELFESYLKDIFANPKGDWEIKKINQLSENLDSRRIPITKKLRRSGIYPYYGASGIVDCVSEYIFDEDALLVSEDGANLVARSTPIAFSVSGKYWVNNHAHILKFEELTTQRLVEYYFSSIKIDRYVTGAAQPKLSQRMLNLIDIPVPTLDEQKEIVTKLDALSAETKKLEEIYKHKLALLDELKKSLLQQAFTGQL